MSESRRIEDKLILLTDRSLYLTNYKDQDDEHYIVVLCIVVCCRNKLILEGERGNQILNKYKGLLEGKKRSKFPNFVINRFIT